MYKTTQYTIIPVKGTTKYAVREVNGKPMIWYDNVKPVCEIQFINFSQAAEAVNIMIDNEDEAVYNQETYDERFC